MNPWQATVVECLVVVCAALLCWQGVMPSAAEVITTPGATVDASGYVDIGQKKYELFLGDGLEAKEV